MSSANFVNGLLAVRHIAATLLVGLLGVTSNALANDGHLAPSAPMRPDTIVVAQSGGSAAKPVSSGKASDDLLEDDDDDDDDDDLLKDDDDPLKDKKKTEAPSNGQASADVGSDARAEHEALFAESRFPAAGTCGTCHPKEYREWSVSQHAYSQLSPVYLSLNNKINELSNGSNGDFCIRCHNQVGANIGENSFDSNLTRHPTSREGITCVVCHRLNKDYGKASGRLPLVEGGLTDPVYGPTGNKEMARVLENSDIYKVVTLPIRLTPMTATCRVPPLSRVKLGIGWSRGVARDAEQ